MKAIIFRTYRSFFRLKGIIPATLFGLLGIWITHNLTLSSYRYPVHDITVLEDLICGVFKTTVYIWTAGLFLLFTAAITGTGAVAGEDAQDTLGLLVSSPVPRWFIVIGKNLGIALALWIYTIIFEIFTLIIITLNLNPRVETIGFLLPYIPWMALYSLLLITTVLSIFVFMSIILKRIPALVASLVLIAVVFLIIPTIRTPAVKVPAFIDFQHQYANVFDAIVSHARQTEVKIISQNIYSKYTQTYQDIETAYDPDYSLYRPYLMKMPSIKPEHTIAASLSAIIFLNLFSILLFRRKDV